SEAGSTSTAEPSSPPSLEPDYNSFRGGKRGGRGGRGRGGRYADVQCQVCSKWGHSALGCWHRYNQQFQPSNGATSGGHGAPHQRAPPPHHPGYGASYGYPAPSYNNSYGYPAAHNVWMRPPPSAFVTNAAPSTSGSWFPDSGASFHVTSDARNLQHLTPFEGHDQIFIGNGQGLHISSSGTSNFPSPLIPHQSLTLHNLLLVPSITKNLISVSQFSKDNNVYFVFSANECLVKSQATDAVLLKGHVGSDGLYEFPDISLHSTAFSPLPVSLPSVNTVSRCNNASLAPSSSYLWHLRLGHPNNHTFKLVMQNYNLPFNNKDVSTFCAACCMGKAHRLHSPASHTTYTTPLELVYSDLWGPSPSPSKLGYNYYISFVDAYSKYTWIYLLKSKSDALLIFKQFKTMVELQFGHPLKSLQTDWGGEFRPFTKFLTELGVTH
ncbi:retrovirus-related Pol polyprotein from transposon TNT 1-94, partial [Trifolium medium]|nr:retrovirus-related Pol polyprotein from transposon TNT 1-94 [Trifolium medium]